MPVYSVAMPGLAVSRRLTLADTGQVVASTHQANSDNRQVIHVACAQDADCLAIIAAAHQAACDLLQAISSLYFQDGDTLQIISSCQLCEADSVQFITNEHRQDCDLVQVISAVFDARPDVVVRIMYASVGAVRSLCNLLDPEEISDLEITGFILKAQARIDARLGQLYRIPLSGPVPEIIHGIASDMAASFVLDKRFSDRKPDQTHLGDVYMRRAEKDLEEVMQKALLDGMPGIVKVSPPPPVARPAIASTTRRKSLIEEALARW